jgi:hypothetical protein
MDKLTGKKELLDSICLSEGSAFVYDENAIMEEYHSLDENKSSLTIKILSIFGGLLATLAFLGFLAIAGLYNSEFGLLIFGIGFIISSIWLNKVYDQLIIDTFSISTYIIGVALLALGLSKMNIDENIIAILISVIALGSLMITQNFILSFISVLSVSGSFLFLIISNNSYDLIHLYVAVNTLILTFLFLNEAKIVSSNKTFSQLFDPVRIGIVVSLLFGLISVGKRNLIPISQNFIWLSSVVLILVTMYLVYKIINIVEINAAKNKIAIYALSGLILIATIFSPSISGAIVIILLCFLVNYKTGLAIGIISIIYFISQYYYDLNLTLLSKSIILFVSGIIFLIFYLFIDKNISSNEKI